MRWIAAFLVVLSPAPASLAAQTPADTTALAAEMTRVLVQVVIPRATSGTHTWLKEPASAFDSLVVAGVQRATGLRVMQTEPDTADWVGTLGAVLRGDTADVLVEVGTTAKARQRRDYDIDTYEETRRYRFVRSHDRWVFLRQEFVRGLDIGSVRG